MIVSLITTATEAGRVPFRLPEREEPWTLDAVLDVIDAASTPSGRYIVIRQEDAVLTSVVDRGHVVALVLPADLDHRGDIVPLDGMLSAPMRAERRVETKPLIAEADRP